MKKTISLIIMASVFGLTSCATTSEDAFYNTCIKFRKTAYIKTQVYDVFKDSFNWKDSNDKKTMCKTIAYSDLNEYLKTSYYSHMISIINEEKNPDRLKQFNQIRDTYYQACKAADKTVVDKIYAAFTKDYESVPSASDVETMCKNIKTIAYPGDLYTTGNYGPQNPKFAAQQN